MVMEARFGKGRPLKASKITQEEIDVICARETCAAMTGMNLVERA